MSARKGIGFVTVKGLDRVKKNLGRAINRIKSKTTQGLGLAALIIKRDSMERTPVDTSALKNSAFTFVGNDRLMGPFAVIGYTQYYAVFVHEDLEAKHIVGEAKFLQKAVNNKKREALEMIAKAARV